MIWGKKVLVEKIYLYILEKDASECLEIVFLKKTKQTVFVAKTREFGLENKLDGRFSSCVTWRREAANHLDFWIIHESLQQKEIEIIFLL